ncbi:MAG: hypothetical protein IPK16_11830 [Anaerolineales bacterium]|nr:hypothetical protein [Anaerolineales bacterium]
MVAIVLLATLLLAACGPSNQGGDEGTLRSATFDIARAYKTDGDTAKARAAVDALKVANPRQWLVLLTEQTIAENQDAETAAALAKLAVDLNMDSASVLTYATRQGLVTRWRSRCLILRRQW